MKPIFKYGFILLLLLMPLVSFADQKIAVIEIQNETHLSTDQIRNVISLHEGDPFSQTRLDEAVSNLGKWGRFSKVEVVKSDGKGGVSLRFIVKEGFLVNGIDIYGTYPFLSTKLRRYLNIHSGELYDAPKAELQRQKLADFYEKRGYSSTEVTLDVRSNNQSMTVDLTYHIKKGSLYRIGKITVIGNTVFPHGYFNSQINPLIAYEPSRLRKKLEKIRKDYQNKGYLKARVQLKDLGKDLATNTVNPTLQITEGKHVSVVFEGNHRVSRGTFKKIIPLYTEGDYGEYEIEAAIQSMKDYYHKIGCQEVAITFEKKELKNGTLFIRFLIKEGPQTRVQGVEIEGNKEISTKAIKKELTTKEETIFSPGYYYPRTVDNDFKNLPSILENKGALEGQALEHETSFNQWHDKAKVSFVVQEGPITKIDAIRFTGNAHIGDRKLTSRLKMHVGDPFSPKQMEQDKDELVLTYANQGYPYMQVAGSLVQEGNKNILSFQIDEGKQAMVGEILIIGNERTTRKAIEKGVFLKPGRPFSYQKLLDSERALRRTGSFRSVNIETIGLAEKKETVHLLVKVEEFRKLLLDVGITYDTQDSFIGTVGVTHLNLFGSTKSGIFKATGGPKIQRGDITLRDPYFFARNLEADLNAYVMRRLTNAFDTDEAGGSLSFLKEFTPRTNVIGRYSLIRTFFLNATTSTGQSESDHTTSLFSFSLNYDRRNSFSDPTSGYVAFSGLDISNKILASTFNYLQPKGYFTYYLPMGRWLTLLSFFRMEGIKVFGTDNLTQDRKLYLGGDYSVRGFGQDEVGPVLPSGLPAGGQLLLAQTEELHLKLFAGFKLATFLDNGSITDNFSQVDGYSFRHSYGFGLRYFTPVGPLRVDYGIKIDRRPGESFGHLHITFGYAF
jgi:outer membrane protein insertion porin family